MARFFLPRHGRTHCPGGSDPIPPECLQAARPWFRQKLPFASALTPLSVPADTEVTLQWDAEDFGDGGDTYFEARTGPDRFGVLAAGWVHMYGEVLWEDIFHSECEIQMHDGGDNPLKQTMWNSSPQSQPTQTFNWTQRMSSGSVEFKVCHGDSLTQNISAAYIEFVYLGAWSGTDPQDLGEDPRF